MRRTAAGRLQMEFNEKLQELRKNKGLTQEELAEKLFVSRTAVSKWESGRGYPSIDSLKEISRFFSVTVDELICPEEILSAAQEEKQALAGRTVSFLSNALDLLTAIALFLPVFGNGNAAPAAVTLFGLTGVHAWVKITFLILIGLTALNGLCGLILLRFDRPVWNKHRLVTGMALSVLGVAVFIAARQPYAGIFFFALLIIKTFGVMKVRGNHEYK
ncbi:MAG: helix-turn-helix domain-containing protein [Ruminococcaceae bacterium]|nr:helix-turn-helix domain-containing protein [Oscillospiraceae bacterium]